MNTSESIPASRFRSYVAIGFAVLFTHGDTSCAMVIAGVRSQGVGQDSQQEPASVAEPDLAKELVQRMDTDQAARMKIVEFSKSQTESTDPEVTSARLAIFEEIATVDRRNREWLRGVVAKNGWPGKSMVGEEASNAAWLLVQHADEDVKFQRYCLDKMREMSEGEVTLKQIVYLTDRVFLAEGQPQVYGTQCIEVNGKFAPRPVSDPHQLDERRKSVGLPTIAEYLRMMADVYKTPDAQSTDAESQADRAIEAQSLAGTLLRRLPISTEQSAILENELAVANEKWNSDRDDPENLIWVGRRLAYLSRYRDSIGVFTQGIEQFPDDARFLRHRGHRWITVREFDRAIADFEAAVKLIDGTADEFEPDGRPNSAGIPTGSLHTNIWYHLGLARFLQGDFEGALSAYEKCLAAVDNNDKRVATLDWQYMTLCRLGRKDEAKQLVAPIGPELKILENHAYHRRLLLYRGLVKPEDLLSLADPSANSETGDSAIRDVELATNGFGVGHWYLIQGDEDQARKIFEQVVAGKNWGAFGYIAAEAELERMKKGSNANQ